LRFRFNRFFFIKIVKYLVESDKAIMPDSGTFGLVFLVLGIIMVVVGLAIDLLNASQFAKLELGSFTLGLVVFIIGIVFVAIGVIMVRERG
jgi:hypothetical protein